MPCRKCGTLKFSISDGQPNLVLEMQTIDRELVMHACVIGAFEHPSSERGVNLHRAVDNPLSNVFVKHLLFCSVSSVSTVVFCVDMQQAPR